ncbi:MAG: hypothetical protein QF473_01315 [Planctomycetota bacterium]|jgi:hypothetical protein|nr:hypothetical protein [Planctomycetota bacterium]
MSKCGPGGPVLLGCSALDAGHTVQAWKAGVAGILDAGYWMLVIRFGLGVPVLLGYSMLVIRFRLGVPVLLGYSMLDTGCWSYGLGLEMPVLL